VGEKESRGRREKPTRQAQILKDANQPETLRASTGYCTFFYYTEQMYKRTNLFRTLKDS
jgi:hypothetical protein